MNKAIYKEFTNNNNIFSHASCVIKNISIPKSPYILFFLQENKKNTIEIYDIKEKKIINTIKDVTGNIIPHTMTSMFAYIHKHTIDGIAEDGCSLFNIDKQSRETYLFDISSKMVPNFIGENNNLFLFPSSIKKNSYRIIDIKNNKDTIFKHENSLEECFFSHNKKYIFLYSKESDKGFHITDENTINGSRIHILENNTIKKISSQKLSLKTFNQNSSLFTFFDPETKIILTYSLEENKIINQYDGKKDIEQLLFLNDETIIFQDNEKKYYAWKTRKGKPFYIPLDKITKETTSFFINRHPSNDQYILFTSDDHSKNIVYNYTDDTLDYVDIQGYCTQFIVNNDISSRYGLLCSNNHSAYLYKTHDSKLVKLIDLGDKALNPWAVFSPCEKFIALYSYALKKLYIYSLEKKEFVLVSACIPDLTHHNFYWYKNNCIIFAPTETDIMMYNYKNYQKKEFSTHKAITSFNLHNDLLVISANATTKLIALDEIEETKSIEYPFIKNQNNDIVKKNKKENEKTDPNTFYDEEGTLVTIEKKENSNYCIIG